MLLSLLNPFSREILWLKSTRSQQTLAKFKIHYNFQILAHKINIISDRNTTFHQTSLRPISLFRVALITISHRAT